MSPRDVLTAECDRAGVKREKVLGPSRVRALVDIRRAVAFHLHFLGHSLPEIGQALGGRHHTTILSYFQPDKARVARRHREKLLQSNLATPMTVRALVARGAGL